MSPWKDILKSATFPLGAIAKKYARRGPGCEAGTPPCVGVTW